MGTYQASGKQVLYVEGKTVTHIADAGDNETTGVIVAALNNNSNRYIADASRTLSPSWHGDKVSKAQFLRRINAAIDATNKLDQLKKTLFYGRDNNLITEGQLDVKGLPAQMTMPNDMNAENVIHAIIGKFTEAGELLEALRACYNGEIFDRINALEEIGDGFWYDAILLKEADSNFEDEQRRNIAKLRARFPDVFGPDYANNRDLEGERAILEGNKASTLAAPLVPTPPVGGAANVEEATRRSNNASNVETGQIPGNQERKLIMAKANTRKAVTARGSALLALIAAAPNGVLMLTQEEGLDAVNAGHAVVDTNNVEGDTAAVTLTDAGHEEATRRADDAFDARQPIRKSDIEK